MAVMGLTELQADLMAEVRGLLVTVVYSSNELVGLSQRLCHDDSITNILLSISVRMS